MMAVGDSLDALDHVADHEGLIPLLLGLCLASPLPHG
jgi:hypothetical protein